MSRPWMPWYIGDYLRDTAHLSTSEHGAYLLLIAQYWQRGPLPDDDRQLAAITRLSIFRWQQMRPKIQSFFYLALVASDDEKSIAEQLPSKCWRHKRVDDELERAKILSLKRKIAGQKGGMKSNGYSNRARFINGAIGKQTGDHSPSKKDIGAPVIASSSLSETIKAKGWIA